MGVAPDFAQAHGASVQGAQRYALAFGEPISLARSQSIPETEGVLVSGYTLLALSRYDASSSGLDLQAMDDEVALEAKRLLRGLIRHQLGESGLQSRQAMIGLARLRQRLLDMDVDLA
jgi:hypothetical protein